ncbi:MAG TPA: hypothetical protein VFX76_10225 [Roseiflexaceae bacterium]|nr:hypothetical protein [Roseiflexaceae bacterium]
MSDADLQVAARVLAQAFGGPVRVRAESSPEGGSGRANLFRCSVLDGPSGAPTSAIVKRVNVEPGETYDPAAIDGPASRLFNEWASLQFLSTIAPEAQLAPRFYGGDRAVGLIVMEDLGEGESLIQPLLGDDRARAEAALDIYFRSLGRLNALSAPHIDTFWRIRDALGPRDPLSQPTLDGGRAMLAERLDAVCDAVGLRPAVGVAEELAFAAGFSAAPGPFAAFSQSDTCPDNCLRDGDWMRFLDFEWGWIRHALNDGARARSNFPTCWCVNRLPDETIRRTEAVYRAELVKGCPAAADDRRFGQEIVNACAFWTLFAVEFYQGIWEADSEWGTATVRQRLLARLELLSQASVEFDHMPALGDTARRIVERLRVRWPELELMPLYPPFRS